MRVGVIDIGTNTVRLLVADVSGEAVTDVERSITFARLGEGVDRDRVLADAPIARTLDAIATYAERWRAHGCEVTRAIATSAVRDAANRDAFVARARAEAGVVVEVISGDEEAALSFAGATVGFPAGPVTVLDIGGGSTEIVHGMHGHVTAATSLDIGAVRLTERHITHDPPTDAEIAAVRADARTAIATAPRAPEGSAFVGLAGTITTLTVLALGLPAYDRARVHHARLSLEQVGAQFARLRVMTSSERATLPSMPGREDVILAGAIIFEEVMKISGFEVCTVSESDILDGTAIRAGAQESADGAANA